MIKKKAKAEMVKKEETRPVSQFEEMESYFNRFFRHPFSMTRRPVWPAFDFPKMDEISPSVDIFEEKGDMVIKAEMPGMNKEDVNVSITENTVTISGEKKQEEKVEKKDYYRVERSYGSFCRSFRLPENVNSDKVKASFKGVVLEVRIPKTKGGKQKKVAIS